MPQPRISPHGRPASSSAYLNGPQQSHATYPHSSKSLQHQSFVASSNTNDHASNVLPISSEPMQGSQPALDHSRMQYPDYRPHQSQYPSHLHHSNLHATPQTRSIPSQTPHHAAATPNTQTQGRLPSPIINRPSMSPTQGNPDVGPVAGVPWRNLATNTLSPPPSCQPQTQHQNQSASAQQNHANKFAPYINGTPKSQAARPSTANHDNQPPHLSGLSPTKHSPILPPPVPSTSHNNPSSSPHHPPATAPRSVSGTPVFPPSEMLQPSPKQLSKSPVPTPSKTMTPAAVGKEELRRVSEEIRGRVEEGRSRGGAS